MVVGPNGSGKSNVVDAIKWVLGEQSIKSLRGKEMADVIFNGSPTRRGMNAAEITLTLDNSNRLLAIDTPEVQITRRVYRSGEGEYLINRNPGRLRDIRDLLTGTGLGTQAYSVIEQGKVDVLLQSSAKDRRMIFEEAAGISRFKAQEARGPAAAGTGRAEPAPPLGHRRRGGKPPPRRAGAGRQGAAIQGTYRSAARAAHASRPGRLAAAQRAAGRKSRTRSAT